jgi:hypothetical protein
MPVTRPVLGLAHWARLRRFRNRTRDFCRAIGDRALQELAGAQGSTREMGMTRKERKSVWIVGGSFIVEPYLGGQQLAEVGHMDLTGYDVTHVSQEEFDAMLQEFFEEHGHYPDQ